MVPCYLVNLIAVAANKNLDCRTDLGSEKACVNIFVNNKKF